MFNFIGRLLPLILDDNEQFNSRYISTLRWTIGEINLERQHGITKN